MGEMRFMSFTFFFNLDPVTFQALLKSFPRICYKKKKNPPSLISSWKSLLDTFIPNRMKTLIFVVLVLNFYEASSKIFRIDGAASRGENGVLNIGLDLDKILKQTF